MFLMKFEKKIIIFLLIILSNLYCKAQDFGSPLYTNFSSKEYDFHTQNWDIVKDNRGVLYFANSEGILEFDGKNWQKILVENNFAVKNLAIDKTGRIYVASEGAFGFLEPNSIGKMQYRSISSEYDSTIIKTIPNIWRVRVLGDDIFFCGLDVFYKYSPYKIKKNRIKAWYPKVMFFMAYSVNNKFYIQESSQGLLELKGDSLISVIPEKVFNGLAVFSMLPGLNEKNPEEILIITNHSFLKYNPKQDTTGGKSNCQRYRTDAEEFIQRNYIYDAEKLPGNKIAIATITNGMMVIDNNGKVTDVINKKNGLQDENIRTLKYYDNSLWLALNNGITQVEITSPFRIWDYNNKFKGGIEDITRFYNELYVATNIGIYYKDSSFNINMGEISSFIKLNAYLTSECWQFLHYFDKISGDSLMLTCQSVNIYEINKNKELKNICNKGADILYQSKFDPDIIYCGGRKNLFVLKRNHNTNSWDINELSNIKGDVKSIIENKNDLWIATFLNGIYKITKNNDDLFLSSPDNYQVKHFDKSSGISSIKDIKIYEIDEVLVFVSHDGRFYKYNEKNNFFVPEDSSIKFFIKGKDKIQKFEINRKENIWVENKGILYKQADKTYKFDSIFANRIPFIRINTAYFEKNTWFAGGPEGLLKYNKTKDYNYSQNFTTIIRKVIIAGDSALFFGTNYKTDSTGKKIPAIEQPNILKPIIDYKYNSIVFDFAALWYIQPKTTLYSFNLDNFDKTWSTWSNKTEKEYTNLPEGKYIFKVKAKNIYGFESEIATYEFKILPPWYRTWWSYIIYFILGILFIYTIVKLNSRRLVKIKIKLEKTVKQRTTEIQQQNEEIQTQADNLLELNNEMKLKNAELFQQKEEIQTQTDNLLELNSEITLKNTELFRQKEEIQSQSDNLHEAYKEIFVKNEQITASVRYASKIQNAVLPFKEIMLKHLKYFILFKPKDIVSGDFYWFIHQPEKNEHPGTTFVATVDCTGHGVPGAFMSMIGTQLLNKIVNVDKITSPAEILTQLDIDIKQALKQKETRNRDGMDICLCKIEKQKNTSTKLSTGKTKVTFSGAKRPLYVILNNKNKNDKRIKEFKNNEKIKITDKTLTSVIEISGDRKSIGGRESATKTIFSNQKIILSSGDLIFITSDGYIDQNNSKRKRFGTKKFIDIISNFHKKTLQEQNQILETELNKWQENEEQRDDITILGIKI
jgi:serine phosphatase RsbU (regulator of sigma subunit)